MGRPGVVCRDRGAKSGLGGIHNVWALKAGRESLEVGQREEEELKKERAVEWRDGGW